MRVLLKDGAAEPSAENILVLPQTFAGHRLETLAGEEVEHGFLAEAPGAVVVAEINRAAKARHGEVGAKDVHKDVKWLSKALAEFEPGSRFGLKVSSHGFSLDHSEAKRIDRAEGLAEGDAIAIGPTISPRALMNAHGKVLAIAEDSVEVELDPGDRDRIERATGKAVDEQITLALVCVEKR